MFLSFRAHIPSSALPVLRNKTKHVTSGSSQSAGSACAWAGLSLRHAGGRSLSSMLFCTSAFHQYPAGHFLYMFSPFHLRNRNRSFKIKCTNYFPMEPSTTPLDNCLLLWDSTVVHINLWDSAHFALHSTCLSFPCEWEDSGGKVLSFILVPPVPL